MGEANFYYFTCLKFLFTKSVFILLTPFETFGV